MHDTIHTSVVSTSSPPLRIHTPATPKTSRSTRLRPIDEPDSKSTPGTVTGSGTKSRRSLPFSRRSSLTLVPGRDFDDDPDDGAGTPEDGVDAVKIRRTGPSRVSFTLLSTSGHIVNDGEFGCCGSVAHHRVVVKLQILRDSGWFQLFVILVVLLAGAMVGAATYDLDPDVAYRISVVDVVILSIFTVEAAIKIAAAGNKPYEYFEDSWNVFDFLVVVIGWLPFGGSAVTLLRLVRLLRVLKLVRALPKLRILVIGLLKSLSSIAYIGTLLGLLFFVYGVYGASVFAKNDPRHFGSLHIALLTLFRIATLEDWTDVMYINMEGCGNYGYEAREDECTWSDPQPKLSMAYFSSFVILANLMILNLFIGVITMAMDDARAALEKEMEVEKEERRNKLMKLKGKARLSTAPGFSTEFGSMRVEEQSLDVQLTRSMNDVTESLANAVLKLSDLTYEVKNPRTNSEFGETLVAATKFRNREDYVPLTHAMRTGIEIAVREAREMKVQVAPEAGGATSVTPRTKMAYGLMKRWRTKFLHRKEMASKIHPLPTAVVDSTAMQPASRTPRARTESEKKKTRFMEPLRDTATVHPVPPMIDTSGGLRTPPFESKSAPTSEHGGAERRASALATVPSLATMYLGASTRFSLTDDYGISDRDAASSVDSEGPFSPHHLSKKKPSDPSPLAAESIAESHPPGTIMSRAPSERPTPRLVTATIGAPSSDPSPSSFFTGTLNVSTTDQIRRLRGGEGATPTASSNSRGLSRFSSAPVVDAHLSGSKPFKMKRPPRHLSNSS